MRYNVFVSALLWGAAALATGAVPAVASDWTRFRGPNGSGISPDEATLPTTWSSTENLKWKVPLPGPGSSSPIIVGDRVFVTCWTGYGTDRNSDPGDQEDLKRSLVCLDRNSGSTLWEKSVEAVLPEDEYGGMFAEHGYASHTPVSDGERVYVFFGKTGALAFDLEGNQLWHTKLGEGYGMMGWGSASSPILYKNLVIVTSSAEDKAVIALNKDTGAEVWRAAANGLEGTWGTPILVEVDANRTDLVLGAPYEIWGLNPDTGKLAWFCDGVNTNSTRSSVVAQDGIIYQLEDKGGSVAVRAGGSGDVSKTHVLWSTTVRNGIGTPILADNRLYFISNKIVNCVDAATGQSVSQSRLAGGAAAAGGGGGRRGGGDRDYSSPILADGKLYYVARSGEAYVVKLGEKPEVLAVNRVTADVEDFSASPAVSDGDLFIRSSEHLYCISES